MDLFAATVCLFVWRVASVALQKLADLVWWCGAIEI